MSQCCSSPTSSCDSQGLQIHDDVKEYYGKYLKSSKDLKTNACVTPSKPIPKHIREALNEVHEEVSSRYYGCGLVVPECLENCRILDLGSGSGRDCYMLSKLVGQKGYVTGLDMTDEQVQVSRKYIDYHTKKFGYQQPNINFVSGYIEDLKGAGLEDQSNDIIMDQNKWFTISEIVLEMAQHALVHALLQRSNLPLEIYCVVNLSPDKKAVLREAYRLLKHGGELYFSDVYSDKPIPNQLRQNKVLWGECISGALCWEDLYHTAEEIGFSPPRLVTSSFITVNNKELEEIIGDYKFVSATFRLFKLPKDSVKEKGLVIYNGGITGYETEMQFDANFTFKVLEGEVEEVDEELWRILKKSRFSDEFLFQPSGKATSCQKKKEIIRNPFQLANDRQNLPQGPTNNSCCGPKGCC